MFGCITPADEYHENLFRRLTGERLARNQKPKAVNPPATSGNSNNSNND